MRYNPAGSQKHDTIVQFVKKERLDQLSQTGQHQGVIASAAAYEYAESRRYLKLAEEKGEDPFDHFWIISKIRTILVRSSVPQIRQVHMA